MKKIIIPILLLITISSICYGQMRDTSYFDGCNTVTCSNGNCSVTLLYCGGAIPLDDVYLEDTLTADRLIEDSIGRTYQIEYRYVNHIKFDDTEHAHYFAIVSISQFKGNKQKVLYSNIKAIYSPVECVSDNRELWLKRLYQYQNSKK